MNTHFFFPFRVHRQTSQSNWGSLVSTDKLIGLNSEYVFPPCLSLRGYTHPEDAVSHTTTTLPGRSQHPKSLHTVRYFLSEV